MAIRSWIRKLFASRTPRTIRKAPARFQPCLENLEDRLAPATFNLKINPALDNAGAVAELIGAINTANGNGQSNTINLFAGRTPVTYTFSAPDNYWYGPDALPAITSALTIEGDGATLRRDPTLAQDTAHAFRFFYVSGGLAGELPLGSLTLENLTLEGGLAKGGNGFGGGGGMGAGGAMGEDAPKFSGN